MLCCIDDDIENNENRLNEDGVKKIREAFSNHDDLINILKSEDIRLYSKTGEDKTIFRTILEEVFNGNDVLRKILNSFVTITNEDENSEDFNVMVDFSKIFGNPKDNVRQTQIMEDLLDMRDETKQRFAINGMYVHYTYNVNMTMNHFITSKLKNGKGSHTLMFHRL